MNEREALKKLSEPRLVFTRLRRVLLVHFYRDCRPTAWLYQKSKEAMKWLSRRLDR